MTVEPLRLKDPRKKAAALLSTMSEAEISSPEFYEKLLQIGKEVIDYDNQLIKEQMYRRQEIINKNKTPEDIKQEILWNNWLNSQTTNNRTCIHCGKPRKTGRFFCSNKCRSVQTRRSKMKVVK